MPNQPLMGASKELATAVDAGEPDQGETSTAISSADMFEAEKLESFRSPVDACASLGGESAKEQQPSFLLGQFQVKSCEPRPQLSLKVFCVRQILETDHEVIDEAHQVRLALALWLELLLEPQVQVLVEQEFTQHVASLSACWTLPPTTI